MESRLGWGIGFILVQPGRGSSVKQKRSPKAPASARGKRAVKVKPSVHRKRKTPPPPVGRVHQTHAAIALGLARDLTGHSLKKLTNEVAARAAAVAEIEKRLRGDDSAFDFEADSLQKRLLKYFQAELGYRRGGKDFVEADKARRSLLAKVERAGLLGLHPGNKELAALVRGFSDYDLWLLNTVVVADNHSARMQAPEVAGVISRKLSEGRGEDVIKYLAARLEHHEKRMKSPDPATLEVFNPALVVLSRMWTDPECPLWLLPSAAAVEVIHAVTGDRLKSTAYNTLVKGSGLPRLPQDVFDDFMSNSRGDARCIQLRQEIEAAAGMSLDRTRRGRRRKVDDNDSAALLYK